MIPSFSDDGHLTEGEAWEIHLAARRLLANRLTIPDLGDETNNGEIYIPLADQTGYVAGFSVTYSPISDGTGAPVPEPGTIVLLGSSLLMIPAATRRKRQADCGDTAKK